MKKFRLGGIEITGDGWFHGNSSGMATESISQPQRKFQCHLFTYRNRLHHRPVDQLRGHQSDDKQSPWHVKVLKSAYRAPAFLNIGAKGVRLAVWNSAVGQPMGKLPIRTFQPTFLPSPASKDPADLICKCPDSSQMQLAECIDYANAYWILLLSTHSVCVCWLAAHSTRICYRIKLTKDRLSGISPFSLFLF